MDKIIIKDLDIFAYHGVNPEEQRDGQRFLLDVVLHTDLSRAGKSDELCDTVNYAAVCKTVKRAMTAEKYRLIECAADKVAGALLLSFPSVARVDVTLKKPDAPISAKFGFVAVEISRER